GLLGRFGDDPQLLGVGQDNLLGQGIQELDQPEVAGGGLDDHLEGGKLTEELNDLVRLVAGESLASGDLKVLVHDADGDKLLVKVDADEVHGKSPGLGKRGTGKTPQVFPRLRASANPRVDLYLPLIASVFAVSSSVRPRDEVD